MPNQRETLTTRMPCEMVRRLEDFAADECARRRKPVTRNSVVVEAVNFYLSHWEYRGTQAELPT